MVLMRAKPLPFELRPLASHDGDALLRALKQVPHDNPTFFQGLQSGMGLYDYLEWIAVRKSGTRLRAHEVPTTLLFAFFGSELIGRYSLRHRLTPALEAYAGHVGYAVLPAYRRMGVASTMLRHAADRAARELGIAELIVTCDEDNHASQAVIEKCGGRFIGTYSGPWSARTKKRYRLSD